jgi:hypothetical protein
VSGPTKTRRIFDSLQAGHHTSGEVARATGLDLHLVAALLHQAWLRGEVERDGPFVVGGHRRAWFYRCRSLNIRKENHDGRG